MLVLAALIGLAFPVAFFAFSYRFSGYGVQGRYILPILAITPMVAGDVIEPAPFACAGAASSRACGLRSSPCSGCSSSARGG